MQVQVQKGESPAKTLEIVQLEYRGISWNIHPKHISYPLHATLSLPPWAQRLPDLGRDSQTWSPTPGALEKCSSAKELSQSWERAQLSDFNFRDFGETMIPSKGPVLH